MIYVTFKNPTTGVFKTIPRDGDFMEGMDGWTMLGEHEGQQPEHSTWVDGQGWVVDEDVAAREAERIRLESLTRLEFMAEVDAKLAQRDVQIEQLASVSSVELQPINNEDAVVAAKSRA